jgi:hypothetical protein
MMNDSRRAGGELLAVRAHAGERKRETGAAQRPKLSRQNTRMQSDIAAMVLRPRAAMKVLGTAAGVLLALSVLGQVYRHLSGDPWLYGLIPQFYVDAENNVPTFFSALLLAIAALILTFIAAEKRRAGDRYRWHWAAIAVLFWCCSVDEAASFHELATEPLRKRMDVGGVLYFAWVVPGFILVMALVAVFYRFVMHLERRVRRMVIASAGVFLSGALGVEMLGAWWASTHQESMSLPYSMIATVEEGLEMAGVILFIGALLTYLGQRRQVVVVRIRHGRQTARLTEPETAAAMS